jgi:hypothetical protein
MSDPLAALAVGVIAWQVRVATGCPAGVAVEAAQYVMFRKFGAYTPTAATTFRIISETVDRVSGVPVTDTYVVQCYHTARRTLKRCKRMIRIPSGQVMGLCYQHGGENGDK